MYEISKELLEEVLGFVEDKLIEEKLEGVELERLLELEEFYERLQDETGHIWE